MALSLRRALALALLASIGATAPAEAGLRETYNLAIEAIEGARWQEAERLLREAIALKPDEARRATFKGILRPYLPHFYRGVALARMGDCRGALEEWRISEGDGAIGGLDLADSLVLERGACERLLDDLRSLKARAEAELDAASAAADRLAEPRHEPVLGVRAEGRATTFGQRLEQARSGIDEIREGLERADADQSPELAEEALARATELTRELEAALAGSDEALVRLAAADERKRERRADVQELARRVGDLLRSKSPLPPAMRGRQQQLESILAGVAALPEAATIEQLDALEERLLGFLRELESSEPPPPGVLRSGAIAFLRADYPEVLARLEEIPYRDPKSRAHGLLLRSAAAFALHLRSGETDLEMLERARTDALAAKATLPSLEPVTTAFSPRFVRFYDRLETEPTEDPGSPDGQERAR